MKTLLLMLSLLYVLPANANYEAIPETLGQLQIKHGSSDDTAEEYFKVDITQSDILWVARAIEGEIGGRMSHYREAEVVVWAMLQRAHLRFFRRKFIETAKLDQCYKILKTWAPENGEPEVCPRFVNNRLKTIVF